ncbi:HSP20 family protein [Desulfacinum infernum DSM 9756]|jgi:HSP20 family protein|uniref:HSP20 family protein n=1 Tax=Desulfacinum infernum DSM 9756 TaxID=1121391 RepID=A0A1M5B3W8_9BACT|nr:Hsp20/alpha crystallin family protein [Desulfacinum infernum]MBC7360089.1 Hsp20/alpha crystallin family protein [Desulfacinum sp.]MBZ4658290.1 Hsp20/alpha crystallin family protein [Desulfacinum sp.]SHF37145.1 HSP20 family protein [Desulfacinum infernum DSM 9756]
MLGLVPRERRESLLAWPRAFDWMDRFFDEMLPSVWGDERPIVPAFDISETDDKIVVKADLPGVDVKDLDISIANNVLTVKGEKKQEKEEKGESYHRIERRFGSFARSITLPVDVKAEGVEAVYRDGVLRIEIPKAESSRPKKIEVKH